MIMANPHPRILPSRLLNLFRTSSRCVRCLSSRASNSPVPSPTPFVPDVPTFLALIGRNMSKFAPKIPSWDQLFTLTSAELRDLGLEPARQRRYLLRQREKFRRGIYGPGGDLHHVVNGVAQLRVVEVPWEPAKDHPAVVTASATLSPGMKRAIVNLPPDATAYAHDPSKPLQRPKLEGMKIHHGAMIKGPFLQSIKGTNGSAAWIKVQEGMWEDKRGHKVDGGERRRAEVRAKRRSQERKASA
jgi:IGR protein motif